MKPLFIAPAVLLLTACNYLSYKPGTIEQGEVVYARSGGFNMRRAIKTELEQRGYTVLVGKGISDRSIDSNNEENDSLEIDSATIPKNVKYVVKVTERREKFYPLWCVFNGFYLWNFNVSIADQTTGEELLAWTGRGCANGAIRKFNRTMDKMEIPN